MGINMLYNNNHQGDDKKRFEEALKKNKDKPKPIEGLCPTKPPKEK